MSEVPPVSVVVPAYNAARHVEEAVASVLGQTWGEFELIVVDDGSTDDTAARVEAFDDARVGLVRQPGNRGVAAARNRVLDISRSEYVAFLDADDISVPERLQLQLSYMRDHPEVDVCGGALLAVDAAGRPLGRRTYPCTHEEIVARMPVMSPLAMSSVMARRDVLVAAGGFAQAWVSAEDYELWSRLARSGRRFGNLPDTLIHYRIHEHASKKQSLRMQLACTRDVKTLYWSDRMGPQARVRLLAERALTVLPPSVVHKLFTKMTYREP